MKNTTNYGFNKPETSDFYNVDDFNENMDILDEKLKEIEETSSNSETAINEHLAAENPHNITKATVGLSNVPNVSTNNQTPTYTVSENDAELASGEKLSVAFGKIAKAISSLISHISDQGNPHGISKGDVGLGSVPNRTTNDQTPTFTQASTRANITSGEKLSVMLGKISKFYADLKTVAFTGSYNSLQDTPTIRDHLTSTNTYDILSANQGRVLNEKIEGLRDGLSKWVDITDQCTFPSTVSDHSRTKAYRKETTIIVHLAVTMSEIQTSGNKEVMYLPDYPSGVDFFIYAITNNATASKHLRAVVWGDTGVGNSGAITVSGDIEWKSAGGLLVIPLIGYEA